MEHVRTASFSRGVPRMVQEKFCWDLVSITQVVEAQIFMYVSIFTFVEKSILNRDC